MNDVEARELRHFIAVAEALSFSRAAERLGMTQPHLSKAIRGLEEKLGVQLLQRTTRQVSLTPAGMELLAGARRAIQAVEAACRRTQRAGQRERQLLVAVKPGGDTAMLREIVADYQASPGLPQAEIVLSGHSGPAPVLRHGSADAALVHAPFDPAGLDFEPLLSEPRLAAMAAAHPLARRRQLSLADLADEVKPRWVGADDVSAAYWAGQDGTSPSPARLAGPAVHDILQLLETVALGQAVAFLPSSTHQRFPRPDIVYRPVTGLTPSVTAIAWPETSRSLAVAALVRSAAKIAAARACSGHQARPA